MSDLVDLSEFNERVSQATPGTDSRIVRQRGSHAQKLEDNSDPNVDTLRQAKTDNQMWAVYGSRAYSACEKAVNILPSGQYVVANSNELGIHFRKTDVNLDDLIELPDSVSEQVIEEIEAFWRKENHFRSFGFLWKRGVLMWGPPGGGKCVQVGTPILMYDGTIKKVEDVKVGNILMGNDSTPRTVLSLASGQEQMYDIIQQNGDTYTVNESHILSLVRSTWKKGRYNPHRKTTEYIDISVKEYLATTNNFKKEYFGYKASVEFPSVDIPLDPYFLGLWLGDGTSGSPEITTADTEIIEYLTEYATQSKKRISLTSGKANFCVLNNGLCGPGGSPVVTHLKQLNVFNNKHVPDIYKINSRENRLQLLAGLLDSDGYLKSNCFEFSNTNIQLIKDVTFLARSLGFKCSVSNKTTSNQSGKSFNSQSIYISGHTDQIPTRITQKQATSRQQIINPLHTSIEVKPIGTGNYYGFELDGNGRFVLGDFTVTHNTSTLQVISQRIVDNGGISIYVNDPGLTAAGLAILRRVEPSRPLVVMIEDLDAVIDNYGEAQLLALMDGELQIDNVVFIATTNYPERLDKRFVNRPSRFDVVKKIGMPTSDARKVYLINKNARLKDSPRELQQWIEATKDFSIAHIKELIISVEVFQVPLSEAVMRLKAMIGDSPSSTESKGEFGFVGKQNN